MKKLVNNIIKHMSSIKRTYGNNGELLKVEMSKEMKARAERYYKKTKRAQFIDQVITPLIITLSVTAILTAYYLALN